MGNGETTKFSDNWIQKLSLQLTLFLAPYDHPYQWHLHHSNVEFLVLNLGLNLEEI